MTHQLKGEFILNQNTETKKNNPVEVQHKESAHFYSSFKMHPQGIRFAEQEQDEEILLLLRRHFITNIGWIATTLLMSILPLLFPLFSNSFPLPLPSNQTLILFALFYYLLLFGFVIVKFSLWYFHTGLVTTKRLIDIDLNGILYRQVSEAKNKNIEDVSYTQIGFIRSLFNYGDVHVQTAGAENNIEYDRIPKPSKVADIIGDLQK